MWGLGLVRFWITDIRISEGPLYLTLAGRNKAVYSSLLNCQLSVLFQLWPWNEADWAVVYLASIFVCICFYVLTFQLCRYCELAAPYT